MTESVYRDIASPEWTRPVEFVELSAVHPGFCFTFAEYQPFYFYITLCLRPVTPICFGSPVAILKMLFINWSTQSCKLLHINNTCNRLPVVDKGFLSLFGNLSACFSSVEGDASTLRTSLICHQQWSILNAIAPLSGNRWSIQVVGRCWKESCLI
jgi:hypothetical protein